MDKPTPKNHSLGTSSAELLKLAMDMADAFEQAIDDEKPGTDSQTETVSATRAEKLLTKDVAERALYESVSRIIEDTECYGDDGDGPPHEMYLNDFTTIEDDAARVFGPAVFPEDWILPGGLLATHPHLCGEHRHDLHLDGLTTMSEAAAASLGQYQGSLYLSGLTSLSDAAAESLGKHSGGGHSGYTPPSLHLDGLAGLSDAAAESLGKHEGDIYLSGLTSMSDAAAESLGSAVPRNLR